MAKRKANGVTIEWNGANISKHFRSMEMARVLGAKADEIAQAKSAAASAHLRGQMPTSGLFGYHLKLGKNTWIAVIRPNNRAAYAIGQKHPVKRL